MEQTTLTMINWLVVAMLVGLLLEIIGAFLLAVEAIGLERIRTWRKEYFEAWFHIAKSRQLVDTQRLATELNAKKVPAILVVIVCSFSGGIGTWLIMLFDSLQLTGWLRYAGLFVGFFGGVIIGYYGFPSLALFFKAISNTLAWIEDRTQKGVIGLMGFCLLATGFSLQFIGMLPQLFKP